MFKSTPMTQFINMLNSKNKPIYSPKLGQRKLSKSKSNIRKNNPNFHYNRK